MKKLKPSSSDLPKFTWLIMETASIADLAGWHWRPCSLHTDLEERTLKSHLLHHFFFSRQKAVINHKGNKNLSIYSCLLGISSEIWSHHSFKGSISSILAYSRCRERKGSPTRRQVPEDKHVKVQNFKSKAVALMPGISDIHGHSSSLSLRFYLFIHERDTEKERQRHRKEKQAPCREPNAGLDPRSPGSRPGLKSALNCWTTQAALVATLIHKRTGIQGKTTKTNILSIWSLYQRKQTVAWKIVKNKSFKYHFYSALEWITHAPPIASPPPP